LLQRRPRELAGGPRQRVAIGRAIVRRPAVFLFDEPLSNLDAKLRVQMRVEIKKLQKSLGTTSVYVTHDQVEAMTMADRLVVMNAGVAEQIGTPIEVYENPASVFVAGFIGSPAMNLLPARINGDGDGVTIGDGTTLPLPNGGRTGDPGRTVTLGLRPEHLTPSNGDGPGLKLTVDLIEHLGADTLVHGESPLLDGGLLTVRLSGHHHLTMGETVTLNSHPKQMHLFDSESGRRI
ncbi:MAG: TOBE domain-containing protein, partial [Alphaproteobacteria bacterium]|nr:TOBE domain-containing protein [Alphaproteobacteria bacterium]